MGIVKETLKIGAGMVIGYMIGKGCTADVQNQAGGLEIQVAGNHLKLNSKELQKTYAIQKIGQEMYLGDAKHNARGFMELTYKEAHDKLLEK